MVLRGFCFGDVSFKYFENTFRGRVKKGRCVICLHDVCVGLTVSIAALEALLNTMTTTYPYLLWL